MRRRAIVLSVLSSSAVLVAGWQLGTQNQAQVRQADAAASAVPNAVVPGATTPGASTPTPTPTPTPSGSAEPPAASDSSGTSGSSGTSSTSGTSGSFTGTAASTRFGDVQVQITVADGSITDVVALHLTDHDQRSVQISNRAAPVLRQEVLSLQSANVQNVSGATYTSDAYLTSLQSALDQAGL